MVVKDGVDTDDEAQSFASGRYTVRRLLGEGAQKTVYLVRDTALGRDCALAVLKTDATDADDLRRLRREAQSMAGLGSQPHIVTVYDLGEEADAGPYIVSEYVPGGDLRQELRQACGPLRLRRAVAIAEDLCRALNVAHEHGLVHRDVKPSNIWFTQDGKAKLGDFGIAQAVDRARLTATGTQVGTAAYMAPELARGAKVTSRSDLYSVGCVLYEMVAGRPPFTGEDPMVVVSQHIHAEPPPPSEHNAAVTEALEQLILRLLEKAPERRPASADDVLAELERIAEALPQTEAPPRPDRAPSRLWKRPALGVLVALVLLAVLGGGAAVAFMMSQDSGGGGMESEAYTEIRYHFSSVDLPPGETSGDCETTDLVLQSAGPFAEVLVGPVTGDIDGEQFVTETQTVLFADDGCQSGFFTQTAILRDEDGNELHITDGAPISLTVSPDLGTYTLVSTGVETVTGGTGIYEGATGGGTCSWVTVGRGERSPQGKPLGPTSATTEGDCTLRVSTNQAVRSEAPLILGLAVTSREVALFGSESAFPTTVEVLVAYWNGGTQPLTGLSIRLARPEGTEILTVRRVDDEQPSTRGHVWALPDLLPAGEVSRFQFTLQFLSASRGTVPLVVEIDADGFDEPVRSEPLIIAVR